MASSSEVDGLFGSKQPLTIDAAASQTGVEKPDFATGALVNQRWVVIGVISFIFVALNATVCTLIYVAMNAELAMLASGKVLPDRMITNSVFMTLIGATVVQTGLVIKGISNFLFNGGAEEK
jgi:hypothetical protein